MTEPRLMIHHIREAGLCVRGAKQWFALHRIDFTDFLQNGVPVSQIEALNDVLGDKVAKIVREEADEVEK